MINDLQMKDITNFELYNIHNQYEGNLMVSYKGPMDEYLILSIGNYIKELTEDNKINQQNFFKVYMELIQNVAFYSVDKKEFTGGKSVGIGSVAIYQLNNDFIMHIGNVVETENIEPIIEKCEAINKMNRNELREFKRNQISQTYSSSGGGNIGLIQVALSTRNPLDFKLTRVNDHLSFFSLNIKINVD